MPSHAPFCGFGLVCAGLALGITAPSLPACGPDYPNCYLSNSAEDIAVLPTLGFEAELLRILPQETRDTASKKRLRSSKADTDAEWTEVRTALRTSGISPVSIDSEVHTYDRHHPSIFLPEEFRLYARGARAWAAGDETEAQNAWRELLALPEKERFYRTVWAAYMLGRAACNKQPSLAREAFQQARRAAETGYADSQHLAEASWGWEARTHLQENNYAEALRIYFACFQRGDSTSVASIQATLHKAFLGTLYSDDSDEGPSASPKENPIAALPASDGALAKIASNPQLRRIVTAWFVARGGPSTPWRKTQAKQMERWIRILRQAASLSADEADRWSWAAYQSALWEDARHFAELAPAQAPAAEWVRAMLLLRSGLIDDALTHLGNAAKAFPPDAPEAPLLPESDIAQLNDGSVTADSPAEKLPAVRAILNLRREYYADALQLFLHAGHWADAAYVAERVLTIEELIAFIKTDIPAPPDFHRTSGFDRSNRIQNAQSDLRFLLARRLVRSNRFDEARSYFSPELLPIYDSYLANCRIGFDSSRARAERGSGFWAAAKILREHGMELQGTELEPDYAITQGRFQWPVITRTQNVAQAIADRQGNNELILASTLGPTNDEEQRLQAIKTPDQRFHYRYRAADLAWLAAQFLPDNDARTAEVLHTAGRWVAARDPERANLFYRSLVLRCPETELGRDAAQRHWFVDPAGRPSAF